MGSKNKLIRTLLYVLLFLNFFDMFSQFPVMSPFVQTFAGPAILGGIVVGAYSFANMFGNLTVGRLLADRNISIIHILVLALITTGTFVTLYAFVDNVYALFVVRFIHGFASGFVVPSIYTYLADLAN
ncbi:MAG: MFS transporter, partial [Bacilli bacterium]